MGTCESEKKFSFYRKIDFNFKTDCWDWVGAKDEKGYGCFTYIGGKKAHRYSYGVHKGVVPNDMCVLHTCDNRGCVNPEHLWLGTQGENIKDRDIKGRHAGTKQTHCIYGHEFTSVIIYRGKTWRKCATCLTSRKKGKV
jgi:hypothetical protein